MQVGRIVGPSYIATDLGEQLLTDVRARENTKLWAASESKWGVRHR